jgi:hypothetical protein
MLFVINTSHAPGGIVRRGNLSSGKREDHNKKCD